MLTRMTQNQKRAHTHTHMQSQQQKQEPPPPPQSQSSAAFERCKHNETAQTKQKNKIKTNVKIPAS